MNRFVILERDCRKVAEFDKCWIQIKQTDGRVAARSRFRHSGGDDVQRHAGRLIPQSIPMASSHEFPTHHVESTQAMHRSILPAGLAPRFHGPRVIQPKPLIRGGPVRSAGLLERRPSLGISSSFWKDFIACRVGRIEQWPPTHDAALPARHPGRRENKER